MNITAALSLEAVAEILEDLGVCPGPVGAWLTAQYHAGGRRGVERWLSGVEAIVTQVAMDTPGIETRGDLAERVGAVVLARAAVIQAVRDQTVV